VVRPLLPAVLLRFVSAPRSPAAASAAAAAV